MREFGDSGTAPQSRQKLWPPTAGAPCLGCPASGGGARGCRRYQCPLGPVGACEVMCEEGCPKDQELFGDKAMPLDLGLPELCTVSPGQDPEPGPDPLLDPPCPAPPAFAPALLGSRRVPSHIGDPRDEGNPVGEVTTRRDTATPVHRPQRPAGSTHSSTRVSAKCLSHV